MINRPINLFVSVVSSAIVLMGVAVSFTGCADGENFEKRVSERVVWQMNNYPESRLRDIYKNFFQDRFGPGHMIPDSASAGAYLRSELLKVEGRSQAKLAEVTGWRGDYVRVDLSAIKEGLVSYQVFFEAFMESAQEVRMPQKEKSAEVSAEDWKKEWNRIEKIVKKLYPDIQDFQKDSRFLDSLLNTGKYVVHHSEAYTNEYDPHYRLFSKSVYDNLLRQLLL